MSRILRSLSSAVIMLLLIATLLLPSRSAAQESILYTFSGGNDGAISELFQTPNLVPDNAGNFFGITSEGGAHGYGLVFELSLQPSGGWSQTILYSFTGGPDGGGYPVGNLSFDATGNLYGLIGGGSGKSSGVFFQLTPSKKGSWTENVLYSFPEFNFGPVSLTLADPNHFFGTSYEGGSQGYGTVFELANSGGTWTLALLYTFAGDSDGFHPQAGMTIGANGTLYGTTFAGGVKANYGTVFQLVRNPDGSWTHTVIYSFPGFAHGSNPQVTLLLDTAGNLYGTTAQRGGGKTCSFGCGIVFELSPGQSGTWNQTVLYQFKGAADGASPFAPLVMDSSGNLYSTTYGGGTYGNGTIFKLTPTGGRWNKTVLYSFAGGLANDGANPLTGLTFDQSGNLYGMTSTGPGYGNVFELPASRR